MVEKVLGNIMLLFFFFTVIEDNKTSDTFTLP